MPAHLNAIGCAVPPYERQQDFIGSLPSWAGPILQDLMAAGPGPGRALAFGPGLTVEVMGFTLLLCGAPVSVRSTQVLQTGT